MASKFLNSLSENEYLNLTEKLCEMQNSKCYICRKDIDLDLHNTNIDHIVPLANGGKDSEENFALTHDSCNKSKQDANLTVARSLAVLNEIKDKIDEGVLDSDRTKPASLKHILKYFEGSKYKFKYKIVGDELQYVFSEVDGEEK